MSDPSQSWNNFLRGSYKKSGIRKSRSEASNVDFIPDGTNEVEATDIEDGKNPPPQKKKKSGIRK